MSDDDLRRGSRRRTENDTDQDELLTPESVRERIALAVRRLDETDPLSIGHALLRQQVDDALMELSALKEHVARQDRWNHVVAGADGKDGRVGQLRQWFTLTMGALLTAVGGVGYIVFGAGEQRGSLQTDVVELRRDIERLEANMAETDERVLQIFRQLLFRP